MLDAADVLVAAHRLDAHPARGDDAGLRVGGEILRTEDALDALVGLQLVDDRGQALGGAALGRADDEDVAEEEAVAGGENDVLFGVGRLGRAAEGEDLRVAARRPEIGDEGFVDRRGREAVAVVEEKVMREPRIVDELAEDVAALGDERIVAQARDSSRASLSKRQWS
jgi:hypothetical protein